MSSSCNSVELGNVHGIHIKGCVPIKKWQVGNKLWMSLFVPPPPSTYIGGMCVI